MISLEKFAHAHKRHALNKDQRPPPVNVDLNFGGHFMNFVFKDFNWKNLDEWI